MVIKSNVFVVNPFETKKYLEPADFETAISETGFGKFNFLLLLIATPITLTILGETSTLSYVFPVAQCDLNLTPTHKGMINASVYFGMMTSILIWGALTDIFGRKKILITSLFMELICLLWTTVSTNFIMLISAKFVGGFIIIGATTALKPFLTEFHGKKYRSKVPLIEGFLYTVGLIYLPLLAWAVLRLQIDFQILGFKMHAWNVYLLICAIPAIISGLLVMAMPETPKFLMTKGKDEKAMKVFQKIFRMNTGQAIDMYPIKELKKEEQSEKKQFLVSQWKELWTKKYRLNLMLFCLLQCLITTCHCSFQLWLPQWYQSINDYEKLYNKSDNFCQMVFRKPTTISPIVLNQNVTTDCFFNLDNGSVYRNALIVGLCSILGYLTASTVINKVGKKRILTSLGFLHTLCICSMYFAPNSTVGLIIICAITMCSAVTIDTTISIVIDFFPTTLRASALSLFLLFSRVGAIIGNLVLPILLETGCGVTFFSLAGTIFLWTILTIFLPNTHMKSLE